jgi:hypothetical protein
MYILNIVKTNCTKTHVRKGEKMRKNLFLIMSFILLSVLILPEIVDAKTKEDKGPLSKKVFIHYKKPRGKPDRPAKKPKPPAEDEGSYTYIARGLKWKSTENYILNSVTAPDGAYGAMQTAMNTWDDEVADSIFGFLSTGNDIVILTNTDGKNVIEFAPLDDEHAIAVTYVWGYFNAPPRFREIVEVDMIFNTDEWLTWGTVAGSVTDVYDILNIAVHEWGHAAGMGDLYDTTASLETMYGYSGPGEIIKRDLYNGDVAGITNLYR